MSFDDNLTNSARLMSRDQERNHGDFPIADRGRDAAERCFIAARSKSDGKILWTVNPPAEPTLGGVSIDRDGRAVVSLRDGSLVCAAD